MEDVEAQTDSMAMKTSKLINTTLLVAILAINSMSCSKEESSGETITKSMFNGYVQKGPFINGSSVTITQLDNQLNQTGMTFSTKIADNSGNFEERNIGFTSPFVELKADGYYFNEVEGELSNAPITLYALADISDANSVNINILTHLERPRLEYLIKEKGMSFADAKQQARKEVLNVFGVNPTDDISLEQLNLSSDAILLLVSSVVQGHLQTGEVSELLAAISADIRTDGELNNPALGSQLANNIAYLDIDKIQSNLIKKYNELGTEYSIAVNDLNKYVQEFKTNTNYQQTEFITYPAEGRYGLNILADEVTTVIRWQKYSMKANIPTGAKLKIRIKGRLPLPGESIYSWGAYTPVTSENWLVSDWDPTLNANTMTVIEGGKPCDLQILVDSDSDITIEYYENEATEPTKVRSISVIEPEITI